MSELLKNIKPTQAIIASIIILGTIFCIFTPTYSMLRVGDFAEEIMFSYFFLGLLFLAFSREKLMYLTFGSCVLLCLFLKDAFNTNLMLPNPSRNAPTLKIAHINTTQIINPQTLKSLLKKNNPDVVVLQELNPMLGMVLEKEILNNYPYKQIAADMTFGMGIYSKLPFRDSFNTFDYKGLPNLYGAIEVENSKHPIHIISTYPKPLINNEAYDDLKLHLDLVANYVNGFQAPTITLGHYHVVSWSPEIQEFRTKANLNNSRRKSELKQALDHIFYNDYLRCVGFKELITKDAERIGIIGTYQIN